MKQSAGLLVYRRNGSDVEALLVHPGGPFWAKKDVWSLPKGELDEGEAPQAAAFREFKEEIGVDAPENALTDLGTAKSGSKTNYIWAVEGTVDLTKFSSNTFTMEWPPKSGQSQDFPENDRAAWFPLNKAKQKVYASQQVFLDRLAEQLGVDLSGPPEQQSLL